MSYAATYELLPIKKSIGLVAASLGLFILSACGPDNETEHVTTLGRQSNPLEEAVDSNSFEEDLIIEADKECPEAFRGTIILRPNELLIHIIDGEVVYSSSDLGNASDLDSWDAARDHFCEQPPD